MAKKITPPPLEIIAAVDLGSNSFHLVIARINRGKLYILDRLRETTRIAAGLDKNSRLTAQAQRRALDCLKRFGQRIAGIAPGSVRAVGTNTLRRAQNAKSFLQRAQQALGHPIEIIGGREEARLIYLGVSHSLADDAGKRLVVDIGGGSTELIIGERFEPLHMESLQMGCVTSSLSHFPSGAITPASMRRAEIAAQQELQNLTRHYRSIGWTSCIGSSGTINAIHEIITANRWSLDGITRSSLKKLRKHLLAAGHVNRIQLPGLRSDRAPVLPGGMAILLSVFESLDIEQMHATGGALREGLLYDLLGRIRHKDIRDRSVARLSIQYHVDTDQAKRAEQTALRCLKQLPQWKLDPYQPMLGWSARLHEIGLAISHSQYRKHGAYLVEHSDMPGFSRQEQQLLATLILGQRNKFPLAVFTDLQAEQARAAKRLCVLLRLAVLLNRSRSRQPLPKISITAKGDVVQIKFPRGWLNKHPLTQADLDQEIKYLKAAKIKLKAE
ncbi:MAG TPA: exopolyphosphatase [Gammaproteobacteria bacterium]|nr:exopolyphosphatase [Gammaproteobacteria bacterium]